MIWKCPNCETINNSDLCVVCGEAKPVLKKEISVGNFETAEKDLIEKEPSAEADSTDGIIVACLCLMLIMIIGFLIYKFSF